MHCNPIPKFGTDGIRGKVGTELTPTFLVKLGYLIGKVLEREGPILIGNDSRISNSMLVSALTTGLTCSGREVWALGLCPTPAVSGLIRKLNSAGGIMVSASHNPPEDNGIKIFNFDGLKINSKTQENITKKLKEENIDDLFNNKSYGKLYYRNELLKFYREHLIASVSNKNLNGVKVILDLCFGSATAFGENVFKEIGAELTIINGEPNGHLINVKCGSTCLDPLREKVLENQADMGFAFDGDSDRMLAIDGKGRVIDGDHILYLWGQFLQEEKALPENRIVGTIMSNLGLERAWTERGGILERTPVGDQNVHAEMIAKGATLGGEQSGHILSASNGFCGDGLLTALQLSTICHSKQLTLAEWRDKSFKAFPQNMVNIPLPKNINYNRLRESDSIQKILLQAEEQMGKNGRVVIRESGTEPLIRIMVEAESQNLANLWSNNIAKVFEEYLL